MASPPKFWLGPSPGRPAPGRAWPFRPKKLPVLIRRLLGQGRQNWAWPNSRTYPLKRLYISSEACPR